MANNKEPWKYLEDGDLPEEGEEVWVWDSYGNPHTCKAIFRNGEFRMSISNGIYENVLAWMYPPQTPKRVELGKVLGAEFSTKFKD